MFSFLMELLPGYRVNHTYIQLLWLRDLARDAPGVKISAAHVVGQLAEQRVQQECGPQVRAIVDVVRGLRVFHQPGGLVGRVVQHYIANRQDLQI